MHHTDIHQPFPKQALFFTCLQYTSFENSVGKEEIARNEQFLLFPQCFLVLENFLLFPLNLKLSFANSFSLQNSRICRFGKGYAPLGLSMTHSFCYYRNNGKLLLFLLLLIDEEADDIHFLYLDDKNGWTKDPKCILHQPKNKDVVSFEMDKPRSRLVGEIRLHSSRKRNAALNNNKENAYRMAFFFTEKFPRKFCLVSKK